MDVPSRATRLAIVGVGALMAVFAAVAWHVSGRMSVTFDEVLHGADAYVLRFHGDARVNPEDPPLFKRWAGLALRAGDQEPRLEGADWAAMLHDPYMHWTWSNAAVFGQGARVDADAPAKFQRMRAMMLAVAVGLGAAVAGLAWTLSRDRRAAGVAAVAAAAMFAFEPAFLGHATLVKNDVAAGLCFTVAALALVKLGGRLTTRWTLVLAAAAAVAVATKFSGLLLGPTAALVLAARALVPRAWEGPGRVMMRGVLSRLAGAAAVCAVCAVVAWGGLWAAYGFRFSVSPDPALRMDYSMLETIAKTNTAYARRPLPGPSKAEVEATPVPLPVRAVRQAADLRLVPDAWAFGFCYTYGSTLVRWGFLDSEISTDGWWYYFPKVMLYKLPLGTLGLLGLGVAGGVVAWRRGAGWVGVWGVAAATGVAGYYLASAMSGSFNIGIRHLFPALPVLYALAGAGVASLVVSARLRPGDETPDPAGPPAAVASRATGRGVVLARVAVSVCVAGLALESLSRVPDSLSFFNVASRLKAPPERLLGDSNLDWGQGLPALVEWQRRNPGVVLSLAYFGQTTPEAYGLRYVPLEVTTVARGPRTVVPPPGVVAISATHIQEVNLRSAERGIFGLFRTLRPVDRVGGDTFLLYHWPPRQQDLLPFDEHWNLRVRHGEQIFPVRNQ